MKIKHLFSTALFITLNACTTTSDIMTLSENGGKAISTAL